MSPGVLLYASKIDSTQGFYLIEMVDSRQLRERDTNNAKTGHEFTPEIPNVYE